LSKWQISQNGKDILRQVGFIEPNGPSFVPTTVNRAMTISPASMYSGRTVCGSVCGSGRRGDIFGRMAVSVEMHHTGCVPVVRSEIGAIIEHALADRPGDWRVSIIGSEANDRWEMKITGPSAFERSYSLEGSAGEHELQVIGKLVARMVPARNP
jgi:hypothetical protein